MSTLSLETDNTQSVSVMKVKGRVDSETAPELDSALSKLLADGRNKIVLNLQGVDYLSSAGLRTLVKVLKGAQGSGGDVRLASVSEPIKGILLTVGMMQMFKLFSTSEEAVTGF
jgi:anti-anti-sigma factor